MTSNPSNSAQHKDKKTSRWVISSQTAQSFMIDYNWPVVPIVESPLILEESRKPVTVFQQCDRPYGNPGVSELLPTEEHRSVNFRRYSPQSKRLMELQRFYPEEPQLSAYGSRIPVPLSNKLFGWRKPGDYAGLGYEEIDNDGDEEYIPMCSFLEFGWVKGSSSLPSIPTESILSNTSPTAKDPVQSSSRPHSSEGLIPEDFIVKQCLVHTSYCTTFIEQELQDKNFPYKSVQDEGSVLMVEPCITEKETSAGDVTQSTDKMAFQSSDKVTTPAEDSIAKDGDLEAGSDEKETKCISAPPVMEDGG